MTAQLDVLTEKLRSVQAEIEAELAKRREKLRFHLENRRIVFEKEVLRIHHEIKTRASRYLIDANPLMILTAPVIYSLIVPVGCLISGHGVSGDLFSGYKIPMAACDYAGASTATISPISTSSKINCALPYANGAIAFAREVASRTGSLLVRITRAACSARTRITGLRISATPKGSARSWGMKDGVKTRGRAGG